MNAATQGTISIMAFHIFEPSGGKHFHGIILHIDPHLPFIILILNIHGQNIQSPMIFFGFVKGDFIFMVR